MKERKKNLKFGFVLDHLGAFTNLNMQAMLYPKYLRPHGREGEGIHTSCPTEDPSIHLGKTAALHEKGLLRKYQNVSVYPHMGMWRSQELV